jgi:serine/threonine protein kinase
MCYITLSGIPPFNGGTDQEIMNAIKSGKFHFNQPVWKDISANAKDFITQLLVFDPAKRMTAEKAL